MVESTMGRDLSAMERAKLFVWAYVNAACEEVTSRGLVRGDFDILLLNPLNSGNKHHPDLISNLAQATLFGLAHYQGIPSGWTGVALTTVYGLVMGLMADVGDGLFWPIMAHAIADYFIFATIARRKMD